MNPYIKFVPPTAALAACIALSACVTAPPDNSLPQARAAVQSAQANPAVARYDAVDLAAAQRHLINAENANEHQERELSDQEASLAISTARMSQTRADEIVAQGGVSAVDRERAKEAAAAAYAAGAPVDDDAASLIAARDMQSQLAGLSVQPAPQGSMLFLTDNYFDPGRSELKPGADRVLDGLAQYLMEHPERRVRVIGHADETSSAAFNLELSLHRAEAVRTGLIARGVDPVRSEAVGYGPGNPVVASSTGDRLYARGVEILVSDNRGQIASR